MEDIDIQEILSFLGFNRDEHIDYVQYISLKKDIKSTYKNLHDKELKDEEIDELFNICYKIKDVEQENSMMILDTYKTIREKEVVLDGLVRRSSDLETLLKSEDIMKNFILDDVEEVNEYIKIDNKITVDQYDEEYEKLINKIKPNLTGEMKRKTEHFDYLRNLPQPVQKSREWFQLRDGIITASAAADILGESKYGSRADMILDKIGLLPDKYKENMFVHHGKKYELIATKIYEHLFNTKVTEFGLVLYQNDKSDDVKINFMGASPDGISSCVTLDGKPNPLIGRMLEIKCPLKRKIETSGPIDDGICPHYYWVQVQMQLACCKNEECDFWQCNIQEYSDDDWALDNTEDPIVCRSTREQDEEMPINKKLTKGCIIQLLPKDKSKIPKGDRWEWYAKYIYPPNINMTDKEYIEWTEYMRLNWQKLYPEYESGYYYDRILYWKLMSCHNVLIKRDIDWFKSKLPTFQSFWNEILYLRANPDEGQKKLDEWKSKKKVYKKKEIVPVIDTTGLDFIDSPIEEIKPKIEEIKTKKEVKEMNTMIVNPIKPNPKKKKLLDE